MFPCRRYIGQSDSLVRHWNDVNMVPGFCRIKDVMKGACAYVGRLGSSSYFMKAQCNTGPTLTSTTYFTIEQQNTGFLCGRRTSTDKQQKAKDGETVVNLGSRQGNVPGQYHFQAALIRGRSPNTFSRKARPALLRSWANFQAPS